jgi:hypothetical protein
MGGWDRACRIEVGWRVIDACLEWEGVRSCWGCGDSLLGYWCRGEEVTILGKELHELGAVHRHSMHASKDLHH